MSSVGRIIKKARESCKLTQGALAMKACMAQPIISAIENGGRNPTISTLKRLAQALGLRLVVRIEDVSGSGFEWSTSAPAKRLAGCAGIKRSERGKTPSIEPASLDFG